MNFVDPRDLAGHDRKARDAMDRFVLKDIASPLDASFREAYDALHEEFGARGELERKEVIMRWLSGAAPNSAPLEPRYKLFAAYDKSGALAGVRDCHVTFDSSSRICVVYLAHTLVLPPFRRSGLAALLRAVPTSLGRKRLEAAALPDSIEGRPAAQGHLLLAAEMEFPEPNESASIVRLVAYGKAGFSVLAPSVLPYCQPDFRDVTAESSSPRPLPMLAVVRWVDHEQERQLPSALAAAFVNHLYAVFSTHCRPEDLRFPRAHALQTLAASGTERVSLLTLPTSRGDVESLAPLWRTASISFFPPELR